MGGISLISLVVKWGPKLALILLCLLCFYGGFTYKGYLISKAQLEDATASFNHYADAYEDYVDTTTNYQLEYESKIQELDNDTSIDCNSVAPQCLRDAFSM